MTLRMTDPFDVEYDKVCSITGYNGVGLSL